MPALGLGLGLGWLKAGGAGVFSSIIFQKALTHSVSGEIGDFDSFVRTSVATVVEGIDDLTIAVLAEEVRFSGARHVYNLLDPLDLWVAVGLASVSVSGIETTVTLTATVGDRAVWQSVLSGTPVDREFLGIVQIKAKTPADVGKTISIKVRRPSGAGAQATIEHILTIDYKRISTGEHTYTTGTGMEIRVQVAAISEP